MRNWIFISKIFNPIPKTPPFCVSLLWKPTLKTIDTFSLYSSKETQFPLIRTCFIALYARSNSFAISTHMFINYIWLHRRDFILILSPDIRRCDENAIRDNRKILSFALLTLPIRPVSMIDIFSPLPGKACCVLAVFIHDSKCGLCLSFLVWYPIHLLPVATTPSCLN